MMLKMQLGNNCTNLTKMVAHLTEIFQEIFETIINFTPSKFDVKLGLIIIFKWLLTTNGIDKILFKVAVENNPTTNNTGLSL